jgi:predicted PurR-regulated permease PerM
VRLTGPLTPVRRWFAYRDRQRALLRESNRRRSGPGPSREIDEQLEQSLLTDLLGETAPSATGPRSPGTVTPSVSSASKAMKPSATARFGEAGQPFNRHSPFYLGFVGALGAMLAIGLWHTLGRLTTTLTILAVSIFLTLALNPVVARLQRHGVSRKGAVATVSAALLVVFVLLGWLVIPPVVSQGGELAQQAPGYLQQLLDAQWVKDLDSHYQVIEKFQEEFNKKLTDQNFLQSVLGGILGAGMFVANGIFQALTILILTLYFLFSLPKMKQAAYAVVPASRRARVVPLSEEIMRRVGSYAIGQVLIATLNALMSWIMMTVIGVPYAAVLAVAVGVLGIIPMVGATLGALVVCIVAFFTEPRLAVIAAIYYLVYQQIENYVIAPRIMQRTVSVPGAVTVVAALAGGTLLGVLGALLAIPVAAGLLLLFEEVLVPRQRHQ